MAKELATEQRVFEVADAMKVRGEEPTILSVQAATGGSFTTVKKHLAMWQEAERTKARGTDSSLPAAASDRLMILGRDFWKILHDSTARDIEQVRRTAEQERTLLSEEIRQAERAITQLETEKESAQQLHAENATAKLRLEAETQAHRERASAAEATVAQLEARIADLKAELERALRQVETERGAASAARTDSLAAAIENAELRGEVAVLRERID